MKIDNFVLFISIFLLSILSVFFIFDFFLIELKNKENLEKYDDKTMFLLKGSVIEEKTTYNQKIVFLDNNISFYCDSCPFLVGKKITARAYLERYNGAERLIALSVKID